MSLSAHSLAGHGGRAGAPARARGAPRPPRAARAPLAASPGLARRRAYKVSVTVRRACVVFLSGD